MARDPELIVLELELLAQTLEEEGNQTTPSVCRKAIQRIKDTLAYEKVCEAMIAITSNDHIDLGDLVYSVRERELQGWDGPSVKQWGEACEKVRLARLAIKEEKGQAQ